MGHLFTNPNTALSTPGGPTFVGNPHQVLSAANASLPSADAMLGPDVLNPNTNSPNLPFIGRPSILDAARAGAMPGSGTGNAFSPGLSKLGKLGVLLTSGVQGALAGRAASEQAVIQSGGRRAGGAGLGFEAGYSLPFLRSQQAAETKVAQAGAQPFQVQQPDGTTEQPFGNLPAVLASKFISPYLGYQGRVESANIGAQSRENVADTSAQSRENVAQIAHRYTAVPGVGLYDTQRKQLVPNTQQGVVVTPEIAQDYALPKDFIGKPMTLASFASIEKANAAYQPTVRTSTDPLGLTTTSTSQKQRPGTNQGANSRSVINQIPGSGGIPVQTPGARRPTGGGATPATRGTSLISSAGQRLVEGDMDPSQVPKRGAAYLKIAKEADDYSMARYGKHFDMAQAQADYDYAKNPQTQNTLRMINGMTEKGGAIDIAAGAAQNLPQFDTQTFNKIFNAAATQFGSSDATNFHTAMLGLADEYSKVMGGGVSSDTGRDQALSILKAAYSKGQLSGAIDIMRQDISARKQALVGSNRYLMKQYGQGQNGARRTIVF